MSGNCHEIEVQRRSSKIMLGIYGTGSNGDAPAFSRDQEPDSCTDPHGSSPSVKILQRICSDMYIEQ